MRNKKKAVQDFKKKKKKTENSFIKLIESLRESKDMDKIAELFYSIITMYGLKLDEVAAVNYYIVDRCLKAEHNAKFIKDNLQLDVNQLGVDGILQVQRALVNTYIGKVRESK